MKSILVILFLPTAAWGVEAPPPADADLLRLQEAFRLAQTIAPRVWNGFAADDAPIVLIRGEFEYVLNDDVAPDGFEKMTQSFRAHPIYARPRTFPPGLEASFPAIGRDAVVIGVPEVSGRTAAGWSIIVCHELFHVYQRRHGMAEKIASLNIGPRNDANWQLNYPFPYKTERVVRALNLLGWRATSSIASRSSPPRTTDRATRSGRRSALTRSRACGAMTTCQ